MKNTFISLALIAGLSACSGGNPFEEKPTDPGGGTGGTGGETEGGITVDGVPPGTTSPTAGSTIFRTEKRVDTSGNDQLGNGYANSISYNSGPDTFTVNNLAFDGDSPYVRGKAVSSLNAGRFAVYEAEPLSNDPQTGAPIDQFTYRAVYGVSKNRLEGSPTTPTTQFAIIRTGNYIPYGFGGFIYQRDDGVVLPKTLQAAYSGHSAGLRDFNGVGGLQYTTGDVKIEIDSDDFDEGAGVRGTITNRQIYDLQGNNITSAVANDISEGLAEIPIAQFVIGPGVLQESGDLVGDVVSQYLDEDGDPAVYEEGKYYAIVSGAGASEIVGVFVLETSGGPVARDTSGFIVYRDDTATP
jgi:hypothetical protein